MNKAKVYIKENKERFISELLDLLRIPSISAQSERKPDMLLQVAVFDIDKEILPDYGLTYDTYLPEADAIAAFVKEEVNKGDAIICQCNYGQSRSAACAAAILEHYEKRGIDIFRDYRYYPNQLVFNKIYEALEK